MAKCAQMFRMHHLFSLNGRSHSNLNCLHPWPWETMWIEQDSPASLLLFCLPSVVVCVFAVVYYLFVLSYRLYALPQSCVWSPPESQFPLKGISKDDVHRDLHHPVRDHFTVSPNMATYGRDQSFDLIYKIHHNNIESNIRSVSIATVCYS